MSNAMRRGGIPGPESRTGLTRPSMTEAEFERRIGSQADGSTSTESADVLESESSSRATFERFYTASSCTD